jgi:hypothetical protein
MKFKKGTFTAIYIEWIDSVMDTKVWHDFSDIVEDNKQPNNKICTIGYMVTENKKELVLGGSIHFTDGEAIHAGQIFTIPKGCVTRIRRVNIK